MSRLKSAKEARVERHPRTARRRMHIDFLAPLWSRKLACFTAPDIFADSAGRHLTPKPNLLTGLIPFDSLRSGGCFEYDALRVVRPVAATYRVPRDTARNRDAVPLPLNALWWDRGGAAPYSWKAQQG